MRDSGRAATGSPRPPALPVCKTTTATA